MKTDHLKIRTTVTVSAMSSEDRRIVELSVLAENLRKGCFVCHTHLELSDCVGERRYGLASLLYITCKNCSEVTIVSTGKRHDVGENGQ